MSNPSPEPLPPSLSGAPTIPPKQGTSPSHDKSAADTAHSLSDRDTVRSNTSDAPVPESLEIERRVFAERFDQLEELGTGGMGRVIKAFDRKLKRTVAVKRIKLALASDLSSRARFIREAQLAAGLSHANIVTVHDILEDDDGPYLVLEFIDGESLAQRLKRGPIPWREAIKLLRPICSALSVAHRAGIVHRDIKPGNILLPKSGQPQLADFGIARSMESTELTASGALIGTLDYMAPEQMEVARTADGRADIYSLAATLYHMVTGEIPRPIYAESIPEEIRELVLSALKRKPEQRPATIDKWATQLLKQAQIADNSVPVNSAPASIQAAAVPSVAPPPVVELASDPVSTEPVPWQTFRPYLAHWIIAYVVINFWEWKLAFRPPVGSDELQSVSQISTILAIWWAGLQSVTLFRAQRLLPPRTGWRSWASAIVPWIVHIEIPLLLYLTQEGRHLVPDSLVSCFEWLARNPGFSLGVKTAIESLIWWGMSRRYELVKKEHVDHTPLKVMPRLFLMVLAVSLLTLSLGAIREKLSILVFWLADMAHAALYLSGTVLMFRALSFVKTHNPREARMTSLARMSHSDETRGQSRFWRLEVTPMGCSRILVLGFLGVFGAAFVVPFILALLSGSFVRFTAPSSGSPPDVKLDDSSPADTPAPE